MLHSTSISVHYNMIYYIHRKVSYIQLLHSILIHYIFTEAQRSIILLLYSISVYYIFTERYNRPHDRPYFPYRTSTMSASELWGVMGINGRYQELWELLELLGLKGAYWELWESHGVIGNYGNQKELWGIMGVRGSYVELKELWELRDVWCVVEPIIEM